MSLVSVYLQYFSNNGKVSSSGSMHREDAKGSEHCCGQSSGGLIRVVGKVLYCASEITSIHT